MTLRAASGLVVALVLSACSSKSGAPAESAETQAPAAQTEAPAAAWDATVPLVDAAAAAGTGEPAKPAKVESVYVSVASVSASTDRDAKSDRVPFLGRRWCENAKGDGVGQFVTVTFAAPITLDFVGAEAGVPQGWRTDRDPSFDLPTSLALRLDDGETMVATPDEADGSVGWKITPRAVSKLTFIVKGVNRGKIRESCLSNFSIGGPSVDLLPVVAPAKAFAELRPALDVAIDAMASCDGAALKAIAAFPYEWRWSDEGYEPPKSKKLRGVAALVTECKGLEAYVHEFLAADSADALRSPTVAGSSATFWAADDWLQLEMRWTKQGWKLAASEIDLK